MRVFVAGHRGLVGSSVVRNCPQDTEILTAEKSELDLTDELAVLRYLEENSPESIILSAAKVGGIGANSSFQKEFLIQNLRIQNAVIGAANKLEIPKLIFLGSSCIYPKFAPQPINENSLLTGALEPTNEGYAIAKIAGVRLCKAISEEDNLNYISLMPTNLYGPNDNFDLFSSHVPAALIRKFHEAKISKSSHVDIWGTGDAYREFMHVDDLANAIWYMLNVDAPGELINAGTGVEISIRDFARLIAKIVKFEGELKFDTSKPDGTPRKLLDVSKIHSYGWKHKINLEEGLESTYKWYVQALASGDVRGQ